MIKRSAILLAAFVWLVCLNTQGLEAVVGRTLFYTAGSNNTWQPQLDVYFQVNAESINHKHQADNTYQEKLVFQAHLVGKKTGSIKISDTLFTQKFSSLAEALTQLIAGISQVPLKQDFYQITYKIFQPNEEAHAYTQQDSLDATADARPLLLSGIQAMDTIIKMNYTGAFQKNGYYHFPRPYLFFDTVHSYLTLYTEQYAQTAAAKKIFYKTYLSRNPFGNTYNGLEEKDSQLVWKQAQHLAHVDLSFAPSGNYYVNQELRDSAQNLLDKKYLFIQLLNPNPRKRELDTTVTAKTKVTYLDLANTFVSGYTLPQLKAILKMLRLIANPGESAAINSFGLRPEEMSMRNFIYNFWLARDPTNPKIAWEEFADKIRLVNRNYGAVGQPGYETEPGRIYIQYGKPNEIIRVNNEAGSYPYELWQYYAVGNTGREGIFLFYQPSNSAGTFQLLHSTVPDERRDRTWVQKLYPGGVPQNSFSSKAMQYIGNK